MTLFRDDVGREVEIAEPPRRIVSLVPSLTETLAAWGELDRVVGITKYCVHPKEELRQLPRVGGTKDPDLAAIEALRCDLVLANAEENRREDVDALARHMPVWVTYPRTLADAADMLERLGPALGCDDAARRSVNSIRDELARPETISGGETAVYLIWREPYMTINADTYIHDVLARLGIVNLTAEESERYPEISAERIRELDPDWLLLPSEPYPFLERHVAEVAADTGLPADRIRLLPGEEYCWHGVRSATVFDTHRSLFPRS